MNLTFSIQCSRLYQLNLFRDYFTYIILNPRKTRNMHTGGVEGWKNSKYEYRDQLEVSVAIEQNFGEILQN